MGELRRDPSPRTTRGTLRAGGETPRSLAGRGGEGPHRLRQTQLRLGIGRLLYLRSRRLLNRVVLARLREVRRGTDRLLRRPPPPDGIGGSRPNAFVLRFFNSIATDID